MAPAFSRAEYDDRLVRVRAEMVARGLDALIIGDPANINWLTGYDAWSFYTPQIMLVDLQDGPFWMGRLMDAGSAKFTTYLTDSQIVAYPEPLVQRLDTHPMEFLADWMAGNGFATARIGFEDDVYYLTPRAVGALQAGLPNASWRGADLLMNWVRFIKSDAEIAMMRQAGQIAEVAMQTAWDGARIGVRQCDLMADITASMIKGTPEFGGDMPALHPLIWRVRRQRRRTPCGTILLEAGQTVAFELGGCRKRYNVGLARTVHFGDPSGYVDADIGRGSGAAAVMDALHPGAVAGDVHQAWQKVLIAMASRKRAVSVIRSATPMRLIGVSIHYHCGLRSGQLCLKTLSSM